ncbi:MAG TPA: hypothetical protein VFJ16_27730 [Longimicrobium sp.]|nr:hypothetical protein [Longimicrobium sp.]
MDHERVAALHDGKLAGAERDELLAAIAANDEEYELFAETAGVLRELEAARSSTPAASPDAVTISAPPGPVVDTDADMDDDSNDVIPIATRRPADAPAADASGDTGGGEDGVIPIGSRRKAPGRRWMVYGALAAVLAGIGVTAALLNRSANALLDDPVRAVRMLEAGAAPGVAAGWNDVFQSRTRGAGDNLTEEQRTVRVGAYLVDLELAFAAQQADSIQVISGRVERLLDGMRGGGAVSPPYRDLAAGRGDTRELLADGRERVRALMQPDWLELGIWAEAARTAAVRHDAEFFRSPRISRVLDRADSLATGVEPNQSSGPERVTGRTAVNEPMRTAVANVRRALPAGNRANWQALAADLTELLRAARSPLNDDEP